MPSPGAGTPVDCPGGRAVLDRDVGLPEEPGGLGQAGRDPGGRRVRGRRGTGTGRPGGGQHLCLHRGRPPGVGGHRAGPRRRPTGRGPVGGDRLHGRALRRRTGRGPARGGPGGPVRGVPDRCDVGRHRGSGPTGPVPPTGVTRNAGAARTQTGDARHRPGRPLLRSVEPAPTGFRRTLVVHQGGRGVRPQMRLLCHSVVPGQAAVPHHRLHPGRGGPVGRTGRFAPRGGAGGPGPLVVRPRPFHRSDRAPHRRAGRRWPPSHRGAGGGGGRAGRLGPPPLSLPVDPRRRAGRGHPGYRGALLRPLAPARVASVAQAHAPVG